MDMAWSDKHFSNIVHGQEADLLLQLCGGGECRCAVALVVGVAEHKSLARDGLQTVQHPEVFGAVHQPFVVHIDVAVVGEDYVKVVSVDGRGDGLPVAIVFVFGDGLILWIDKKCSHGLALSMVELK